MPNTNSATLEMPLDISRNSDLTNADRIKNINLRIEEMSALYKQWSQSAKGRYRSLNIASIVFSAAVPAVVLVAPLLSHRAEEPWVASVAGLLGACATLTKSIDLFFKDHDTWLRNDDSYGKLKSEQFLFQERAGAYKVDDPNERIATYADRVEAVISASTTSWSGTEKAPQMGVS